MRESARESDTAFLEEQASVAGPSPLVVQQQVAGPGSWPFERRTLSWLCCTAACAAFCLLAIYRFPGAGRDDNFISLWAGQTLGVRS